MPAFVTFLLAVACAAEPTPPGEEPVPDVIETIDETTVGDLGGVRVPMGNMTHGEYIMPDGHARRGLICSLALPGHTGVFVGVGSVVIVEGTGWEVIDIEKKPGELGSVTLKRLDG